MLNLTRFPVSDDFFPIEKRFLRYLTEKFFGFFELLVFDKRSRDHRTHEIVGNSMANPMRALSSPSGTSLGPKVPLKVRNTRLGHEITLSERF